MLLQKRSRFFHKKLSRGKKSRSVFSWLLLTFVITKMIQNLTKYEIGFQVSPSWFGRGLASTRSWIFRNSESQHAWSSHTGQPCFQHWLMDELIHRNLNFNTKILTQVKHIIKRNLLIMFFVFLKGSGALNFSSNSLPRTVFSSNELTRSAFSCNGLSWNEQFSAPTNYQNQFSVAMILSWTVFSCNDLSWTGFSSNELSKSVFSCKDLSRSVFSWNGLSRKGFSFTNKMIRSTGPWNHRALRIDPNRSPG